MLPASNRGAGQNLAFPDVCNTPVGPATVPLPYPNLAMNAQALGFSLTVKVSMMNALNMSSSIPMTNGDQAGVAHPTVMGEARYTMGNPVVYVDKQPAICLLCPTTGNKMNAPLGAVLVPSAVNVFYTLAGAAGAAAEDDDDALAAVRSHLARLAGARVTATLEAGVLALRIEAFPADIVRRVHVALGAIELESVQRIVIDLRGNPGGELGAAVDLAADFLPEGSTVAHVVDADGDVEARLTSRAPRFRAPVEILVDGHTASAAEIFATAMRDVGGAELVGGPMHGKRTGAALVTAPDGTSRLAHVLSWSTESG